MMSSTSSVTQMIKMDNMGLTTQQRTLTTVIRKQSELKVKRNNQIVQYSEVCNLVTDKLKVIKHLFVLKLFLIINNKKMAKFL